MSISRPFLAFVIAAAALSTPHAQERFDMVVRNDLFAGFAGDTAALNRGMAMCEKILADDPDHAEALVWHGSGTVFLAGQAFERGDTRAGMELFEKGIAEMARAVELAPDDISVRIPRGATLREVTRTVPPNVAGPLLEAARTDFQVTFDQQKSRLDSVPRPHPLGELLQALGDIYSRQGNAAEAEKYYALIPQHLPGTEYARRSARWMETRQPLPAAQSGCIGCHVAR